MEAIPMDAIHFYLPRDVKLVFQQACDEEKRSMTKQLNFLIERWLAERQGIQGRVVGRYMRPPLVIEDEEEVEV